MNQKQRQFFSLLVFGLLVASFQNCSPASGNSANPGVALSSVAATPIPSQFPSSTPVATPVQTATPSSSSVAQISCSINGTVTPCCPSGYVPSGTLCVMATPGPSSFLVDLYQYILGRGPDVAGYNYWIGEINSEAIGCASVAASFLMSQEFTSSQASFSNQAFLTKLYGGLLERAPDDGGDNYWVGQLASGMDRGLVAQSFLLSTGGAGTFSQVCQSSGFSSVGTVPNITGF
jgi:hypothetical protein